MSTISQNLRPPDPLNQVYEISVWHVTCLVVFGNTTTRENAMATFVEHLKMGELRFYGEALRISQYGSAIKTAIVNPREFYESTIREFSNEQLQQGFVAALITGSVMTALVSLSFIPLLALPLTSVIGVLCGTAVLLGLTRLLPQKLGAPSYSQLLHMSLPIQSLQLFLGVVSTILASSPVGSLAMLAVSCAMIYMGYQFLAEGVGFKKSHIAVMIGVPLALGILVSAFIFALSLALRSPQLSSLLIH